MKNVSYLATVVAALTLAGCGGGSGGGPANPGDTTPQVSFSATTAGVEKDAGTHNITVILNSPAPSGGLTLNYTLDGTASTVAVPAGQRTATITVTITDDNVEAQRDPLVITLAEGDGYTLGSANTFELTITDDDSPAPSSGGTGGGGAGRTPIVGSTTPRVMFSVGSKRVAEGEDPVIIRVTSNRTAPLGGIKVNYMISDPGTGVATIGDDFMITGLTVPSGTVMIPEGKDYVEITVTITDDSTRNEGEETLVINLGPGDGYLRNSLSTFRLRITDNDGDDAAILRQRAPVFPSAENFDGSLGVRIAAAIAKGVQYRKPPAESPEDYPHDFGAWLEETDYIATWSNPPRGATYNLRGEGVGHADFGGTATFAGNVSGLGHYGSGEQKKGGELKASITLDADFDEGTVTGTVSNFRIGGRDPGWANATLALSGGVTTDGDQGAGGEWELEGFYRSGNNGNPDGANGFIDLRYTDGGAVGGFHATKQP